MPTWDRPSWFPFDVAAFLSDRAIGGMPPPAVAGHVFLLCHAWESGGVLPNDDVQLAQLSRLGALWPRYAAAVRRGWKIRGKALVNLRMKEEHAASHRRMERASKSGRAAAWARYGKVPGTSSGEWNSSVAQTEHSAKPVPAKTYVRSASRKHVLNYELQEPTAGEVGSSRSERTSRRPSGRAAAHRKPGPPGPLDPAWRWLQENADPVAARGAMRFAAWLLRTGTRDEGMLLALVKHFVVHSPRNTFAYYTPKGATRTSIQTRVAADGQIAEHEKIKAEERAMGLGRRSGEVRP